MKSKYKKLPADRPLAERIEHALKYEEDNGFGVYVRRIRDEMKRGNNEQAAH